MQTDDDIDQLIHRLGSEVEQVDVLNAPHHGSSHNSGDALYRRIRREGGVVLAPADGMNGWGHPHPEVVTAALVAGHAVSRVGNTPTQRYAWGIEVWARSREE